MKVALSTDTSCSISKELAKKLNINVFPLNVIVNGEEFLDGVTITQDQLLKDMRSGKTIKTSTPPPDSIITYFTELFKQGYDKIIHFTISSKLSSMNTLFNDISREYFDNKVIVIDSYSVATIMLSFVLHAYELINKDVSPEEIKKIIEAKQSKNIAIFIPENLTALKNGGRISPAIAALCNMIGIKPILLLSDGKLEKDSVTRNVKKSLHERITKAVEEFSPNEYDYTICSFDAEQSLVDFLKNELTSILPNYKTPIQPIAINVCAHCGPGTIGILISKKFENHSITDYII